MFVCGFLRFGFDFLIWVCVNVCVFVWIFKVGSWCIRPLRRGQVDPSALSLARESKGYVVSTYLCFGVLGLLLNLKMCL